VKEKEIWFCSSCSNQESKDSDTEESDNAIKIANESLKKKRAELEKARLRDRKKKELLDIKRQLEECEEELEMLGISESNRRSQSSTMNPENISSLLQQQMKIVNRQFLAELPTFSGNPDDWAIFISQYNATSEEASLTGSQNMIRLRNSIKGIARDAVEGALKLENPDIVISILKRRFGNMDVIIRKRMRDLNDLNSASDSKPASITKFYEFISNLKASLTCAEAQEYLRSPQLLDTIIQKLPLNSQRAWIKHKMTSGAVNVDKFLDWYEPYYQCAVLQEIEEVKIKRHSVNVNQEVQNARCSFCKKNHHNLTNCKKLEAQALRRRWDFVRRMKLCFNCLRGKHYTSNCSDEKVCGVAGCTEKHHRMLHKFEANTQISSHHSDNQGTLFRLVPIKLWNGTNNLITWAFLDEGSGPTLITEKAAKTLNLSGYSRDLCLRWTDGTSREYRRKPAQERAFERESALRASF
jgi:hypothetical protein